MKANPQLENFLNPFDPELQKLFLQLRTFITELIPEANELIWDNYNALAIAYSKSELLKDAFCHIAVYAKHVNFGFNRGAELSASKIKLNGSGKLIRHIKLYSIEDLPRKEISKFLFEALGISEERNPELQAKSTLGKSIVMSISDKKIRPKS